MGIKIELPAQAVENVYISDLRIVKAVRPDESQGFFKIWILSPNSYFEMRY